MAGIFVVFEGPEGGGKSTQIRRLAERLRAQGVDPLVTFEPGGTAVSRRLRDVVLDPEARMSASTEFLLYSAARAQHVEELIAPALREGRTVLCDRFVASSLAYQGYGRGVDRGFIREVSRAVTGGLEPDLTLLYDIVPEEGLRRAGRRGRPDRLEQAGLDFHARVRNGYLTLARSDTRWHTLDASASEDALEAAAWPLVWDVVRGGRGSRGAEPGGAMGASA